MSVVEKIKESFRSKLMGSCTLDDKKLFGYSHFSDYIRPTIFEENGIWRTNDDEYSYIVELAPRIRMGSETAETFEQVLDKIPVGVHTQIILFGSKNIDSFLNNYKEEKNNGNPLVNSVVEYYADFLKSKTEEIINDRFNTQIKNSRVLLTLKSSDISLLIRTKQNVENLLSSNHFYPTLLDQNELKIIFSEMVNPSHTTSMIQPYDERKFFNKQIMTSDNKIQVYEDYLRIDKKYYKALTPLKYPKHAHISEFGLKLGDYISKGMDANQFVDNYLITLNLSRTPKAEINTIRRNKQITKGGASTGNKVKKEKSEIDNIIDNIDERKPMFKIDLNIWISGKSYDQVKSNTDRIKSYWQKKSQKGDDEIGGVILEDFTYALLPLFIGSLPAGINKEYFNLITKTNDENHFANEICQFLPLEADYKGNSSNLLFISRRGQITGIDIFNSDYAKNAFIVAQSGSGKSVLSQKIAFDQYARKYKTFIIDIGESYKNLTNSLEGEYISIDINNPVSFNPFCDLQEAWDLYRKNGKKDDLDEANEQLDFLTSFVYMIGSNLNEVRAKEEQKFIQGMLQDVINELLKTAEGRILEISDLQKYILDNFKDSRLTDFAVHLKPWCVGGIYYPFVQGKKSINLDNPFVVLDLSSVEQRIEIRDALIYLMTSNIASYVYNNHSHGGTQVLIDEAHKFLGKNPHMDAFFDQAYRRFRKHNASIVIITQSFEDIYNVKTGGLSLAGQAIMANSPWKFFLNQTGTAINAMKNSALFTFDELDWELLKSSKTLKGYYSELFLINPQDDTSVLRFVIDKYFYYLSSSDSADKRKIENTMNSYGYNLDQAIKHILKKEENRG